MRLKNLLLYQYHNRLPQRFLLRQLLKNLLLYQHHNRLPQLHLLYQHHNRLSQLLLLRQLPVLRP